MKKLILSALLTSSMGLAYALPLSSDIPLPVDNIIGPRQTIHISGKPLMAEVTYDVTCTLINPNQESIAMKHYKIGATSIDGKNADSQFALATGNHTMLTTFFKYEPNYHESIDLTNLDSTESVQIENCMAKVRV